MSDFKVLMDGNPAVRTTVMKLYQDR